MRPTDPKTLIERKIYAHQNQIKALKAQLAKELAVHEVLLQKEAAALRHKAQMTKIKRLLRQHKDKLSGNWQDGELMSLEAEPGWCFAEKDAPDSEEGLMALDFEESIPVIRAIIERMTPVEVNA